jgi:hypothetical protein
VCAEKKKFKNLFVVKSKIKIKQKILVACFSCSKKLIFFLDLFFGSEKIKSNSEENSIQKKNSLRTPAKKKKKNRKN